MLVFSKFKVLRERMEDIEMASALSKTTILEHSTDAPTDEVNGKLDSLFVKIEQYFTDERPFTDPNFSINKLAAYLNSNVSYVSRALNIHKNINFKTYLNSHRINYVKKKLDNLEHKNVTIQYIYTSAGFLHQSTFNRIFKEIEGITPSEYITKLS
jgi:YesN/AraC family two-component response regulator